MATIDNDIPKKTRGDRFWSGHRHVFLTYGDKRFRDSRKRIAKEAKSLVFFDRIIAETQKIKKERPIRLALKNKEFRKPFNSRRGGGYWMWKPYVILKALSRLKENDILVYSDAGATVPNCDYTREKLSEYIETVLRSDWGVLSFRNPYIEKKWTKGDVLRHFHAVDNLTGNPHEHITNTRQFTANRIIFKKNEHSLKLVRLWWNTATNYPHLFDDSPSASPNLPGFVENRHDQSVWSLICKTHGSEEEYDWDAIPICARAGKSKHETRLPFSR